MALATYISLVQISAPGWSSVLVDYSLFIMQIYLTKVWGLEATHAAGILNIWGGICLILPLFLLFLADAFLGNFWMLVISSIASSLGIGFISISTPRVFAKFSTSTCKAYEARCVGHTQKVLFYLGMALAAVGMSGNLVSAEKLLNEQINEETRKSKRLRITRFILVALPHVIGAVGLPSLNSWSLQFGIPGICTLVAMFLFFSGSCCYKPHESAKGSALTTVCRVFVAAARNRSRESDENGKEPAGLTHTRVPTDEIPPDEKNLHDDNEKELMGFAHTRVPTDEIPQDEKKLHDENDQELMGFGHIPVPTDEIPPEEKNLHDENDKELMGFAHIPVSTDEIPPDEKKLHNEKDQELMGFAHIPVPADEIPPEEKNLHDENDKELMGFSNIPVSTDEIPPDEKNFHDENYEELIAHNPVPTDEIPADEKNLHDENDKELMGFAHNPVPTDEIPPDEKKLHDDNDNELTGFTHSRVQVDEIPQKLHDDNDKESMGFTHTKIPPDDKKVHDDNDKKLEEFTDTRCLRCLEKAVPIESSKQVTGRWRVCTIKEVEEAKTAVRMVPMCLTFIVIGVVTSTANTYFVQQASDMKIEKIGSWSIPIPTFLLFFHQAKLMFMYLYKNFFKKSLERYAPTASIGLAMVLSVLCYLTAATIEKWRRSKEKTTSDVSHADSAAATAPAPSSTDTGPSISALWLVFQFLLLAGVEELSERGIAEFFTEQAPESMKVYLNHITMGLTGLGFMLNVALISAAGGEKQTRKHWQRTVLDGLRLEKYYWLLAILSSVNLAVYGVVAYLYRYKTSQSAPGSEVRGASRTGEWTDSCLEFFK